MGGKGGGILIEDGDPTLRRCFFYKNKCKGGSIAYGGGLYSRGGNPTLVACSFVANIATEAREGLANGGALYQAEAVASLVNCGFYGNQAYYGGAVAIENDGVVILTNCVLSGNEGEVSGGAIVTYSGGAALITNCTIAQNTSAYGGGVSLLGTSDEVTVTNTILWNNSDLGGTNEEAQIYFFSGSLAIDYSCVQGWTGALGGTGNVGLSPKFIDADGQDDIAGTQEDDLRLSLGSSCIDAGDNSAIGKDWGDLDEDGDTSEPVPLDYAGLERRFDDPGTEDTGEGSPPIVDIGAHEYVPDCNGNGVIDTADIEAGTSEDCNTDFIPDECQADCNSNGVPDDCDIADGSASDEDGDGIPDECERVYVNIAARGANDGASWLDAFNDLQLALAKVGEYTVPGAGIEVWVATGTYTPAESGGDPNASFAMASGVELYGGFFGDETDLDQRDPSLHVTILDGDLNADDGPDFFNIEDNSRNVVTATDIDDSAVIDGLWIRGGNGDNGGGMYVANGDPVIRNCVFAENRAASGGGLYVAGGSAPMIESAVFMGNSADDHGGGLYLYDTVAEITSSLFEFNSSSDEGGAVYCYDGSPSFADCSFKCNSASGSYASGGGVRCLFGAPIFVDCLFQENTVSGFSARGGGMMSGQGNPALVRCVFDANLGRGYYSYSESTTLVNCTFLGNSGGGVRCVDGSMTNCLFSGNRTTDQGGGVFVSDNGDMSLSNCTIAGNYAPSQGGGIYVAQEGTTSVLTNCIFWGNTTETKSGESAQVFTYSNTLAIDYSCVQGWTGDFGGVGNFGDDPLFLDADGPDDTVGTADDDLRLGAGSPCIDHGNNAVLPLDTFDLDADGDTQELIPHDVGNLPRQIDDPETPDSGLGLPPLVDIGAHEFQVSVCDGDANGDGIVDPMDSGFILARLGCDVDSGNDSCIEADQNSDGVVDPLDVGYVMARFGACP